jgi:2,4-dienoyl-CoA reductase-like NADH-dependent reductase (Old Yellow Enzyme family)
VRLPLRALGAVREGFADDLQFLGMISLLEGVLCGLVVDDAIRIALALVFGVLDAMVASGGSSSHNPMLLFRGDSMLPHMLDVEPNPLLRLGLRLAGKRFFREYPYHELYFLDDARRIRDAIECKLVYIGGISTRESLERALAEFDFVQLGRALVRDPALVHHMQNDPDYVNGCTHCNRCAALIDHPDGIRCTEP